MIAVVMALSGAGVWALVAQLLVTQSVGLALAWRAARWTPSRQFSAAEFRSMAAFGVRVSAVELVAVARSWAETFLIASSLGAVALGYLSIAQRLVQVVQDLSGSAILPVSVVVFAKIRESADRLVSAYLRALATIYALVTPVLTVVAVTAPLLVPLLFGDDWGASIPVAQALAVAAMLTLAATLDHGLFYGLGRPGAWLFYAIAIDVLTVVTTAVAVRYGLSAVAAAFVGVALVATTARWFLVSWVLSRPVAQVARPFWLGIVPTAVSALAGVIVLGWVSSWPVMMALIVTIATIVMVHLLVVRLVQSRVLVDCVDNLPVPRRAKQGLLQVLRLPRGC